MPIAEGGESTLEFGTAKKPVVTHAVCQ